MRGVAALGNADDPFGKLFVEGVGTEPAHQEGGKTPLTWFAGEATLTAAIPPPCSRSPDGNHVRNRWKRLFECSEHPPPSCNRFTASVASTYSRARFSRDRASTRLRSNRPFAIPFASAPSRIVYSASTRTWIAVNPNFEFSRTKSWACPAVGKASQRE